jgi:tRNA(Ile2) C34 agmatinyltransferase TiaS
MPKVDEMINRRSFLRGSSLFAAAVVAAPLTALAQQTPPPKKKEKKEEQEVLRDANGREYRVCPQCGYNMYKQGRTWTCDNCGYSYVE